MSCVLFLCRRKQVQQYYFLWTMTMKTMAIVIVIKLTESMLLNYIYIELISIGIKKTIITLIFPLFFFLNEINSKQLDPC